MRFFSRLVALGFLCAILSFWLAPTAQAFCGLFVARADANLYNSASNVVIAREGDRNVFLMSNDYEGNVRDFLRIVPIPVIPTREQVRIGDREAVRQIDAFTAPRLAFYDDDPCRKEYPFYGLGAFILFIVPLAYFSKGRTSFLMRSIELLIVMLIIVILTALALPSFLNQAAKSRQSTSQPAVSVEDRFTVGEYDVTILSAEESDGLTAWLRGNGYRIPNGAEPMLQSYIDSGMKFFVVRVNLEEFEKLGGQLLRPIVLDYRSPDFMLPIRLGTLNAKDSDQDLIINILSPDGYAEVSNYPTRTIPTDAKSRQNSISGEELPEEVSENFGDFYGALFQKAYEDAGKKAVFLEYAGNTSQCDPCSMPPPGEEALKAMGAFWEVSWQRPTYVTRLHVRYNRENFPQDLRFRILPPEVLLARINEEGKFFQNKAGVVFQGRYVIREAKNLICFSGIPYWNLRRRGIANLKKLTGLSSEEVDRKLLVKTPANP